MNKTPIFVIMIALVGGARAPRAATTVEDYEYMLAADAREIARNPAWLDGPRIADCLEQYDLIQKAGVPDSTKVTVKESLEPNPMKNGEHTIGELHEYCLQQQRVFEEKAAHDAIEKSLTDPIVRVLENRHEIDDQQTFHVQFLDAAVADCDAAVDKARADGVSDDFPLAVTGSLYSWKGTLGTMKAEVCDAAAAFSKKKLDEWYGPYIAAGLENDKLDFVERAYPKGFLIPGGDYPGSERDPKKLLKARVWYQVYQDGWCADGRPNVDVTRQVFGRDQKLVRETTQSYCGDPGPRVIR